MSKLVALANSLHHGAVRVRKAADGQWEDASLALFGLALGVVSNESARGDGAEEKVEWAELVRVADIESVRAEEDDEGEHGERPPWRFTIDVVRHAVDRGKPVVEPEERRKGQLWFAAPTENDRVEWVRALQLAKQLTGKRPRQRRNGQAAAFLRFASSDSEDCDSDSVVSDISLESWCRADPSPVGSIGKSKASIVGTVEVSVDDRSGKSTSVSIPLTRALHQDAPLHQIKLRALEELRKQLHEALHEVANPSSALASLQDFLRQEADHFVLFSRTASGVWLKDERQSLSHYIKSVSKGQVIALSLEPQSAMPFPTIELSISATKNKVSDLSQKSYTTYLIDVHFNDMRWQVPRRFKEFHRLHQELKDKYPDAALPRLPSKHVFTPIEGQFVNKRRQQLERYMRGLVDHAQAGLDVLLLSFLGVVSTSRDRDLSKNEKSVIHVTALHVGLDYGDVILFSCRFGASVLQRKVTRAKYDHIGIVVPGASRNLLRILEATGEGIQVYSLKARLMAYSREVSKEIVVRRISAPRTPALMEKLNAFVKRVDGNPYSILGILQTRGESERHNLLDASGPQSARSNPVCRRISQQSTVSMATTATSDERRPAAPTRRLSTGMLLYSPTKANASGSGEGEGEEPAKRKYFCSSLAAAALKHLGWLETTHTSSYFWPGSFEEGGDIEKYLAPGVSIGKETVVDCRIIEVGLATRADS